MRLCRGAWSDDAPPQWSELALALRPARSRKRGILFVQHVFCFLRIPAGSSWRIGDGGCSSLQNKQVVSPVLGGTCARTATATC